MVIFNFLVQKEEARSQKEDPPLKEWDWNKAESRGIKAVGVPPTAPELFKRDVLFVWATPVETNKYLLVGFKPTTEVFYQNIPLSSCFKPLASSLCVKSFP